MAATVRATSQFVATASVTTGTVPLPTGWQPGDVMYIFAALAASTGTITAPTGYTTLVSNFHSAATTSATMALFRRVLQSGDTDPAVTCKSGRLVCIGVAVQGADTTNGPEDGTAASDVNTSIAFPSVEAPSVSPTHSDSLLLCGFGEYDATSGATLSFTPPSGMTEVNDQTSAVAGSTNVGVEVASLALTASGATGTETATASRSAGSTMGPMGVAVAVMSAASGGTESGPFTITIPGPSTSLTGVVAHVGSFAVALPAPATSLSGTVTHQGSFALTLPKPAVGLSGTITHQGAFAVTLPPPSTALSGTVTGPGVTGTFSIALPAPRAALVGAVAHTGPFAVALPAVRLSLTASVSNGATPPLGPGGGGSASGPQSGGSASQGSSGGAVTSTLAGGAVEGPSYGGMVE